MLVASACEDVPPNGHLDTLDPLAVPADLRVRVARLNLVHGDLARSLDMLASAPEGTDADRALDSLADAALDRGAGRVATASLRELERRRPEAPATRALALRVADVGSQRLAERQVVDRRVRQLLADLAHLEPPPSPAERAVVCAHLEGLYWARYQRATEPAHQIDALLTMRAVCERDTALAQALAALQARADAADAIGEAETAIAFYEQSIQLGDRYGGLEPEALARARAALRRLLWPTYLERARARFDRRLAEDWAQRGLFEPETDTVHVRVALSVPPDCGELAPADCSALATAADQAARARLAELALEALEMAPASADVAATLGPVAPALATVEAGTAYFAASVPFERLVRAAYDALDEAPH